MDLMSHFVSGESGGTGADRSSKSSANYIKNTRPSKVGMHLIKRLIKREDETRETSPCLVYIWISSTGNDNLLNHRAFSRSFYPQWRQIALQ